MCLHSCIEVIFLAHMVLCGFDEVTTQTTSYRAAVRTDDCCLFAHDVGVDESRMSLSCLAFLAAAVDARCGRNAILLSFGTILRKQTSIGFVAGGKVLRDVIVGDAPTICTSTTDWILVLIDDRKLHSCS